MKLSDVLQKCLGLNTNINEQWAALSAYVSQEASIDYGLLSPVSPLRHQDEQRTMLTLQVLSSLTFGQKTLYCSFSTEQHPIESLTPLFARCANVFNDTLPSTSWIDMESVLKKFDLLKDTQATLDIVNGWKKALEEVHVLFGRYHQRLLAFCDRSNLVMKAFQCAFPTHCRRCNQSLKEYPCAKCFRSYGNESIALPFALKLTSFSSFDLSFSLTIPSDPTQAEKAIKEAGAAVLAFYSPNQRWQKKQKSWASTP